MTTPRQHAELAAQQSVTGALPERDTTKTAEQQGLFRKFDVRRVDGSDQLGGKHHGCRYYVLDVDHDPYAAAALGAYADACKESHPELARDLREKWGAADTIDNLRAQLAEARRNAERWDRAAHCVRLDQFGGFVVTPDEPALDSDISLAFTREIDASIDAARGEKNGA